MSRVCPNCENVISNDELECPYCAGKLPNKDVDTIVNKRTCPECSSKVFVNASRCPYCNCNLANPSNLNFKAYRVTRAFMSACVLIPISIILIIVSIVLLVKIGTEALPVLGVSLFALLVGIINIIYYNVNK